MFSSSCPRRTVSTTFPLAWLTAFWRSSAVSMGWPSTLIKMSPVLSPAFLALSPSVASKSAIARPLASSSRPMVRPTGTRSSAAKAEPLRITMISTAQAARIPNFLIFSILSNQLLPQYLICRKAGNSVVPCPRKNMRDFLMPYQKPPQPKRQRRHGKKKLIKMRKKGCNLFQNQRVRA